MTTPDSTAFHHRWRLGKWRLVPAAPVLCYLLSAIVFLAGAASMVLPRLGSDGAATDLIILLVTLTVYEAVLTVLALVVGRWRHCREDTLSLTVIIVVFMVASGLAVDVLAVDAPYGALLAGVLTLLWMAGRMLLLGRRVLGPFSSPRDRALCWPLVLVYAVGQVQAGMLGVVQEESAATSSLASQMWVLGWLPWLLAACWFLMQAHRRAVGSWRSDGVVLDPLTTLGFKHIVMALLFIGAGLRHVWLTEVFALDLNAGVWLLPVVVLVPMVVAVCRLYDWHFHTAIAAAAAVSLVWLLGHHFMQVWQLPDVGWAALVQHPAVMAVLAMACWLLLPASVPARRVVVGLHVIVAMTLWVQPGDRTVYELGMAVAIAGVLLYEAWWRASHRWAMWAGSVLAVALVAGWLWLPQFGKVMPAWSRLSLALVLWVWWGQLALFLWPSNWRQAVLWQLGLVTVIASSGLMLASIMPRAEAIVVLVVVQITLSAAVWWRTRHSLAWLPCLGPGMLAGRWLWLRGVSVAWLGIASSFVLLLLGGFCSWRQQRAVDAGKAEGCGGEG